jgi:hypothetical protein
MFLAECAMMVESSNIFQGMYMLYAEPVIFGGGKDKGTWEVSTEPQ